MARIRSIKPELWQDEALGACPIGARLLFIGIITQADDHGRFRAAPALVRSAVFPYDDKVTNRRVAEWLAALADAGLIRLYTVSGERFGDLPGWEKHQRLDNAAKPVHPPFQAENTDSPRSAAIRRENPRTTAGEEGRGEEGIGGDIPRARGEAEHLLATWVAQPGLIQHQKVTSVIETATKKARHDWTLPELDEAIQLYATVLSSSKHYFSHQWTLAEFLTRGSSKFVAESQPLTRYFGDGPDKPNSNGTAPRRPPDRDALVQACRSQYQAHLAAGASPADARLEVMGHYKDEILALAIPPEVAA